MKFKESLMITTILQIDENLISYILNRKNQDSKSQMIPIINNIANEATRTRYILTVEKLGKDLEMNNNDINGTVSYIYDSMHAQPMNSMRPIKSNSVDNAINVFNTQLSVEKNDTTNNVFLIYKNKSISLADNLIPNMLRFPFMILACIKIYHVKKAHLNILFQFFVHLVHASSWFWKKNLNSMKDQLLAFKKNSNLKKNFLFQY